MKLEKRNKNKFLKDGIILLNKSKGITSFSAINKLKWLINGNKIGHAGTLDPMAEGLLVVMVNDSTKFSENLMKKDKEYYVEMKLGYETDTYDEEGEVVKKYNENFTFFYEKIENVVMEFLGNIEQIPPMYSAIKVNGEKLYNLARQGIEIEREKRKVKINYINNLQYNDKEKIISFNVGVSSGTYIRSLVRDIGEKLGVYATMTKLVRTKIDKFSIKEAITLENVIDFFNRQEEIDYQNKNIEKIVEKLINFKDIEHIFEYEKIYVNEEEYKKLKNGMTILVDYFSNIENIKLNDNYMCMMKKMENEEKFLGIVQVIKIGKDKIYLKRNKYFK